MSYDSKCYDLAEAFLEDGPVSHDHESRIRLLAQHIQTSIEDWLEMNRPTWGDGSPAQPKCKFCGAKVYEPCDTQAKVDRCELPPLRGQS